METESNFRESEVCFDNTDGFLNHYECVFESWIGYLQLFSLILGIVVFIVAIVEVNGSHRPLIRISKRKSKDNRKDILTIENIGNRIARKVLVKESIGKYGPYILGPGEIRDIDIYYPSSIKVTYKRWIWGRNLTSYFDSKEKAPMKVITDDISTIAGKIKFSRFLRKCSRNRWSSDTIFLSIQKWDSFNSTYLTIRSDSYFNKEEFTYLTESRFEDVLFCLSEMFGFDFKINDSDKIMSWQIGREDFNRTVRKHSVWSIFNKKILIDESDREEILNQFESRGSSKTIKGKVYISRDAKGKKEAIHVDGGSTIIVKKVLRSKSGLILFKYERDLYLSVKSPFRCTDISVILNDGSFTTSESHYVERYKFDEDTHQKIKMAIREMLSENNRSKTSFMSSLKMVISSIYWSFKSPDYER